MKTITKNGKLFIEQSGDGLREVVLAQTADLAKFHTNLVEGFYFVGTGNTGAASALAVCGVCLVRTVPTARISNWQCFTLYAELIHFPATI